jgi:glycosyltransferase involved in cell wall biosynthesis
MKIGIEAQRIFRAKKHGMDIYALELIKAIQKTDTQNEYVVFVKPDVDVCLQASKNLKIVEVSGTTYIDWEQIYLPKAIEKEKIDLMHFTSNTASNHLKCPFIITIHDIIYLEKRFSKGSLYQIAGHLYRRWNVPKIASKASYILTVSEYEKKRIQEHLDIQPSHLKAIYNAYNQQFRLIGNKEALAKIQQKYHLPSSFIFFLGNQAPKKNMKRVLEAYIQYFDSEKKPIGMVIAESSAKDILKILTELDRNDVFEKITLTGYVPHTELPFIYNLATLFLYPSLRESFGIPIIEAMACGTPVITSNTSAMPEVAEEAAILVNPLDSASIATAISKVLDDKKFRNYLIFNGLCRATHFSWEATAEQTIALYQSVFKAKKTQKQSFI